MRYLTIILLFIISLSASADYKVGNYEIIVTGFLETRRYGVKDNKGNVIIEPSLYYIDYCSDGTSEWFIATTFRGVGRVSNGEILNAKRYIDTVIDINGNVYAITDSYGNATRVRETKFIGSTLYAFWSDKKFPIKGATRQAFAAKPKPKSEITSTSAPAPTPTPTLSPVTKEFPSLEMVVGSVRFVDAMGLGAIDANGAYAIEFEVKNIGKGHAKGCSPMVTITSGGAGLTVKDVSKIDIAPGATKKVSVPLTASMSTVEGQADFSVQMDEPNGFGTDKAMLSVKTHAFEAPQLVVNDYTVTSSTGGTTLQKKIPFNLQLLLQNVKHGKADNVQVSIKVPDNVFIIEGNSTSSLGSMDGGQTRDILYSLVANNNYTAESIPIDITVKERFGCYAENRRITLQVNQPLTAQRIVVDEKVREPHKEIELAQLNSDVDVNVPRSGRKADNTYVVIIVNENYTQVASVPYAANDGAVFAEYCRYTIGVPERNIRTATNATLNEMKRQLNWLTQVGREFGSGSNVIVYYSGHGVPDESTGQAYLLPVDGYHFDMSTNLAVGELYKTVSAAGFDHATIFLDACFSGSQRGDNMLVAARGVALKAKDEVPTGKIMVLSAAQGDETAYPIENQHHGLFTYFLLKKLQQTHGDVTLGELSEYVIDEVKKESLLENSKLQTPQVQVSPSIANSWRTLSLGR